MTTRHTRSDCPGRSGPSNAQLGFYRRIAVDNISPVIEVMGELNTYYSGYRVWAASAAVALLATKQIILFLAGWRGWRGGTDQSCAAVKSQTDGSAGRARLLSPTAGRANTPPSPGPHQANHAESVTNSPRGKNLVWYPF